MANLLVVINLLAFACHTVLDSLRGLWRQARAQLVTRPAFFEPLRSLTRYVRFPDWTTLLETLLKRRSLQTMPRGPTPA